MTILSPADTSREGAFIQVPDSSAARVGKATSGLNAAKTTAHTTWVLFIFRSSLWVGRTEAYYCRSTPILAAHQNQGAQMLDRQSYFIREHVGFMKLSNTYD